MTKDEVIHDYFEWLSGLVCKDRFAPSISYRKLFTFLHDTPFRYSIVRDKNRAADGEDLRYRYALTCGEAPEEIDEITDILAGPCSVLEMIIALAIRAEETIMDDALLGDRTAQWFWKMVSNVGLGSATDINFDVREVSRKVDRLLDRRYKPDGTGGLFTVYGCEHDLREVEIWYQLCWYLDDIT
jgi:hypothetical protein